MITRRKFITGSAAVIASAAFVTDIFSIPQQNRLKDFGFISGIIGSELKGDWKAVLRMAASFGYTEIETGGFLGESAESYLAFLKEIGLKPIAGGINFTATDEELMKSFDLISKLGMKIAVTYWPWYTGGPFSLDECKRSAERLNILGQKCHENGLTFCWHNHDKEFIPMEEGLPFDYLMANTDSKLVKCELDIYWVAKGGGDPLSVLKKYRGRYNILHIKDMAPGEAMDFECPGSGIIDFRPIFSEAYSQGINHYMVERDNVPDGIACLRSASEYLKNLTF
ncbi:MAG: sugar phosphate isomerase/epimerase [Bacteroidales bacterium]|nr:sugar phosphate isomerase/epimerase [Bacteroidales bacterium]